MKHDRRGVSDESTSTLLPIQLKTAGRRSLVQRAYAGVPVAPRSPEGEEAIDPVPTAAPAAAPVLQRAAAAGTEGARVADGAEPMVAQAVGSAAQPIPSGVRERFESSLGADLSSVRIHSGAESAQASAAVGARAYTMGNDIHFADGSYTPGDPSGLHLLAHEVAHTVQQRGATPARQYQLEVSSPGDAAEVEADRAADAMVAGHPAAVSGGTTGAQLQRATGYGGGIVTGGPRLVEVQNALNQAGFDCGPADGIMGPRTRNAVRAFQASRGLMADGIIGPQTLGALGLQTSPASPGSGGGMPAAGTTTPPTAGGAGSSGGAPATHQTTMSDGTGVTATAGGYQGVNANGIPVVGTTGSDGQVVEQEVPGLGYGSGPKPDGAGSSPPVATQTGQAMVVIQPPYLMTNVTIVGPDTRSLYITGGTGLASNLPLGDYTVLGQFVQDPTGMTSSRHWFPPIAHLHLDSDFATVTVRFDRTPEPVE